MPPRDTPPFPRGRPDARCQVRPGEPFTWCQAGVTGPHAGEPFTWCQAGVTGPHDCGLVSLVMGDPDDRAALVASRLR